MTETPWEELASRPDPLRRRLVNWLAGGSAGALAGSVIFPLLRYLSPPRIPEAATDQIEAGHADDPELLEKGFKIVRFGSEPVILVRTGYRDFRAFAATCTHLDCIVEYRPERQALWCNCHNGHRSQGAELRTGVSGSRHTRQHFAELDAGTLRLLRLDNTRRRPAPTHPDGL